MRKQVLPSLLSADFFNLNAEMNAIESAGIETLHLDVMDGHFVPNISFGPGIIKALRPNTELFFDCHLMVEEPDFLFEDFKQAGCDLLTVQQEAVKHLHRSIQRIHSLGMKAGVSLNPATALRTLKYVLDDVDLILIMSVNPGFGGQSFIPQIMDKIRAVREMIDASGRDIILEVDGGIKADNLKAVIDAGCDWAVAGSAIFRRGQTAALAKAMVSLLDA